MTDTAREAAIERVRAWARIAGNMPDDFVLDRAFSKTEMAELTLGDLRFLLSEGEGGSVASLPVMTVGEPATASEREQLKRFKDWWRWLARQAWDDRLTPKEAIGIIRHHPTVSDMHKALTDPRQPSEAPVTARAVLVPRELSPSLIGACVGGGVTSEMIVSAHRLICAAVEVERMRADLSGHPREAQSEATASLPKPPVTADEGWIEWAGGVCPTDVHAAVEYRVRCVPDVFRSGKAGWLRWAHAKSKSMGRNDIIAYRLVTPAPPTGEGGGL